ncbi:hypothetical protein [Streptomyces sp. NPDC056549]|uniref:hypothetical protein n=1 Tax=Streptomyces sp. NPDC056549 TaxID=3345864 RepID=UPI0036A72BB8
MGRVYATVAQYETFTGVSPAPPDTAARLATASRMLDRKVVRYYAFAADPTGLPTKPVVAEALATAVCAQVSWWAELGGSTSGADAVGWATVSIGSVSLGGGSSAQSGDDTPARQIAPEAWDALLSPDLTPDIWHRVVWS